ncbi:unnamed protein product [Mytilus coruscus]|uniref:CCHC-type domain-containing protein n=1 Tax=Mytilus coruscus TaxID=42192 RepID=A0A6J8AG09_MYTCO|nr:unnamed protein product [Mytilus coruscus]
MYIYLTPKSPSNLRNVQVKLKIEAVMTYNYYTTIGIIIGSVIGGILVISVVLGVIICITCRGRRSPGQVMNPGTGVRMGQFQSPNASQPAGNHAPPLTESYPTQPTGSHPTQQTGNGHTSPAPAFAGYTYNTPPPAYSTVPKTVHYQEQTYFYFVTCILNTKFEEDTVNFKEMKTLIIWVICSTLPLRQASEQTEYTFGQNCSVVATVNPVDEIYVLYEGGSLSSACDTFQFKHNSSLCITSLKHDDPDCAVELQYYIKTDSGTPEKRYTCTKSPDEDDFCVDESQTMFLKLQSLSNNRQNVTIKLRIKLIQVEVQNTIVFYFATMSGQNSENPASDKMPGTYVLALKHNNNTNKDNAEPDGEIFNVNPVFILESPIFARLKPDKNDYLTHTEIFKCIDLTIPANHLNGLQRVIGGNTEIECTKCLQKGHKTDCNNDWKCKTCSTNGHISKDCTAEFDKNSQADSEVSSEESDEVSEDESEKDEEIVSSQSTENLLDTCTPHTEEPVKMLNFPKIQTTYMYRTKTHLN